MNGHQNGQITNGKSVNNYAQDLRIEQYKASLFLAISHTAYQNQANVLAANSVECSSVAFSSWQQNKSLKLHYENVD